MLKRNERFKKKLTTYLHTYCNESRYIKSIRWIGRFEDNCLPIKCFFLGFLNILKHTVTRKSYIEIGLVVTWVHIIFKIVLLGG